MHPCLSILGPSVEQAPVMPDELWKMATLMFRNPTCHVGFQQTRSLGMTCESASPGRAMIRAVGQATRDFLKLAQRGALSPGYDSTNHRPARHCRLHMRYSFYSIVNISNPQLLGAVFDVRPCLISPILPYLEVSCYFTNVARPPMLSQCIHRS